jgi:DNA-binding LytR/AlgR family response regulator
MRKSDVMINKIKSIDHGIKILIFIFILSISIINKFFKFFYWNLKEIKWVEALGDYIKIITDKEKVIVLSTLKSISDKLPNDRFLRIHRSYIVNLNKVEKFGCTSVEIDEHQIPMSRKQKPKLEFLLEKFDS